MTLATWWYRVSGQAERDEVAAIRSMAYRFGQTAATLLPEINALTALVGIERLPDPPPYLEPTPDYEAADKCTASRWESLTGSRWRNTMPVTGWRPSAQALYRAQDHASRAADFAAAAVRAAEHAAAMLDRLHCDACALRLARGDAESARDLVVRAHHHMLDALTAYDKYERLLADELAPADLSDLDLDLPAPVEQPIPVPDWPVRQRRAVRP